jgi:hypothetical protein
MRLVKLLNGTDHLEVNSRDFDNNLRQHIFKMQLSEISSKETTSLRFSHALSDVSRYLGINFDNSKIETDSVSPRLANLTPSRVT